MTTTPAPYRRLAHAVGALLRDRSGLALIEFAYSAPLVMVAGFFALEYANLALVQMRVNQVALGLADNISRSGSFVSNTVEEIREFDVNDALLGAKLQGENIGLTTNGRITVSSLEADVDGNQRIHWQRCIGKKNTEGYTSNYGITATNNLSTGPNYDRTAGVNTAGVGQPDNATDHPGSDAVGGKAGAVVGMGKPDAAVTAPPLSGVIFVEVNYEYRPLLPWVMQPYRIHSTASYVVRNNRDFKEIYNPKPNGSTPAAKPSYCDVYSA